MALSSWRFWLVGALVLACSYAGLTASTRSAAVPSEPCPIYTETSVRITARSANTLTHSEAIQLAPRETNAETEFERPTVTLRAQVFAENRSVPAETAELVLGTVETEQGVRLAPAGSVTDGEPFTVRHPGMGTTRGVGYYAVFAGHPFWQGTYAVLSRCPENPSWTVTSDGTFSSFEPVRETGAVLCTLGLRQYRSSYVRGSLAFRACSRSWW